MRDLTAHALERGQRPGEKALSSAPLLRESVIRLWLWDILRIVCITDAGSTRAVRQDTAVDGIRVLLLWSEEK